MDNHKRLKTAEIKEIELNLLLKLDQICKKKWIKLLFMWRNAFGRSPT